MPYANSNGVRIHYQTAGEGPPLLLLHGFTDSLESWRERGYVPALRQHFIVANPADAMFALCREADGRYANAKGRATHIPNATFVSLPGLKHAEGFFRSDLVLPHVTRFLGTVLAS